MATAKIVITDSADDGVIVRVESEGPEIPLDADGNPEVDNLTNAQAIAIGAVMAVASQVGELDFRTFFRG